MPSLLEALERKYFSDYESEHDEVKDVRTLNDERGSRKRLISIFIPRLSPLMCVPELLVLNDCDIDRAGDFDSIREKCQHVRELDLAQNKLQDWQEVFQIVTHMPRIEFLNLSKNHLSGPLSTSCVPSISNLRSIVLNGTYLSWESIEILLKNLPMLEELHLSLNSYKEILIDSTNIDNNDVKFCENCHCEAYNCRHNAEVDKRSYDKCRKIPPHTALKTLHFTGNPVEKWTEICRFGRIFPCLEKLVLAKCPIKAIALVDDSNEGDPTNNRHNQRANDASHEFFPSLQFLNLSSSSIDMWDNIDRLARFPKLMNLRVKNWPLWENLDCTEHERRQLLIARLPNVTILNGGGVIGADEREAAERAFIRYYMERTESERPLRYNELVAKHGRLDPLVNVNFKPEKRVKIFLTYRDQTESRLVDINRTVQDLKFKLEKLLRLPSNKMRLFYLDQHLKDLGPEEMRFPNKLLYSYNIHAGDEIIVDEKK
uniref:Ubiquitin-like domain-containing protein n=1 Tax=Glossina brevipalpis TaxID=37001 RepID=A0A1A9W2G9_9MUSC